MGWYTAYIDKEGMRVRPVIGLIPLVDEGRESLWMLPGYMDAAIAAGALPVMLPLTDDAEQLGQLFHMCDGILLTGGHDVSPELYGAKPLGACEACSPERDRMETKLLEMALAADKPVLGICRGIQLLNAALGGTLWQDLPSQHPSEIAHRMRPPYDAAAHMVTVLPDTPLAELLGAGELPVNSRHHQAVRGLAAPLRAMAVSPDGLVEAAWYPGKRFVWGVQWHPEHSWRSDPAAMRIFKKFTDACRG